MTTIIVNIDNENNARSLSDFLKNLNYVKSVKYYGEFTSEKEEMTDEDWVKPGRPATEKEFEALLKRSEATENVSAMISQKQTMKKFDEWVAQNIR